MVMFLLLGYVGIAPDHTYHLISAHQAVVPNFAMGDWFTYHATGILYPLYTPLNKMALRFGLIHALLFTWYVTNIILLVMALRDWLRFLSNGIHPSAMSLLLACGLSMYSPADIWGGYSLIMPQGLPCYMFYPFSLWALLGVLQGKIWRCTFFFVIGSAIHLAGAPLLFTVLMAAVFTGRNRMSNVLLDFLPLVAVFLVTLAALFWLKISSDGNVSAEDYKIFFYGRAPWHYAPHIQSWPQHARSILVILVSWISVRYLSSRASRAVLLGFTSTVTILFGAGFLFITFFYWPLPIRSFPFRLFPLLNALNAVLLSHSIFKQDRANKRILAFWMSASLLAATHSVVLALSLLAVIMLVQLRGPEKPFLPGLLRGGPWLLVALISVAALQSLGQVRFFPRWPTESLTELAEGLRANTPEGSTIVVPPDIEGVRIAANRAIVVDFKCLPVFGQQMKEWAQRMNDVTGLDPATAEKWLPKSGYDLISLYRWGYDSRTLTALAEVAHKYKADYILVRSGSKFDREARIRKIHPVWSGAELQLYSASQVGNTD